MVQGETFKQTSTKVPDDLAHQGRRRMEAWEVEMVSSHVRSYSYELDHTRMNYLSLSSVRSVEILGHAPFTQG